MKRGVVFVCFICALSTSALLAQSRTRPSAALANFQGWFELPNTRLQDVCPPDQSSYPFSRQCKNVIAAWSGAVADTRRHRLILWGGGHNSYYGNEIYSLNLDEGSLTRLNSPSPIASTTNSTCGPNTLADGSPNARQTYGGLVYIEHADRMFAYGGVPASPVGCSLSSTWTLNLATLQWQNMDPHHGPTPQAMPGVVADYDPNTKLVFLHDQQAFFSYNYDTNTYTELNSWAPAYPTTGVIDPVRKLFIMIGGDGVKAISIAPGSKYQQQDWTLKVTGCEPLRKAYVGLAYDRVLKLVVGWNGGDSVYLFDPDTKTCTAQTYPNGPGAPQPAGTFGRWRYLPQVNAFVLVNDSRQNAFLLRLSREGSQTPGKAERTADVQSESIAPPPPRPALVRQEVGPAAAPRSVTPSSSNTWAARCADPDVVRCWGFDEQAANDLHVRPPWAKKVKQAQVVHDVVADGAGSLRFTIPSPSSADGGGSFWLNFTDDNSVQFGPGEEFFVQYRVRYNDVMIRTKFKNSEGFKSHIIGEGDRPGYTANSCSDIELVVQNVDQRGYPMSYHSCGVKDGHYEGFQVPVAGTTDYLDQNAAGCLHYGKHADPPCFLYRPNEWITFQVHVKVGTWYLNDKNYRRDSTYELWAAHEGEPSRLLISFADFDLANPNSPAAKFGKIWLLPYQTNKDSNELTGIGYVWYDDLIISRRRIPDPDVSVPNAPDGLRARPASNRALELTWRSNSRDEQGFKIERCQGSDNACYAHPSSFKQIAVAPPGAAAYTDSNAKRDTRYTYRVRAFNPSGDSAYSGGTCWVSRDPCYGTASAR